MLLRLIKAALVFSLGLYFCIVAYDNMVDFNSNFVFTKHILSMDTTFQRPVLIHRAIHEEISQKLLYETLIAIEVLVSLLCITSSLVLAFCCHQQDRFTRFKPLALGALFSGFLYFFGGFIIVAGEWFCMWQSKEANAQPIAGFFSLLTLLMLVFLAQKENC